jgi:hypothetical protein
LIPDGVSHTQIEVRIRENGSETVVIDTADERMLTAQEIVLLAELSGALRPIRWYGGYDVNMPLDAPEAKFMVAVLQKID